MFEQTRVKMEHKLRGDTTEVDYPSTMVLQLRLAGYEVIKVLDPRDKKWKETDDSIRERFF